MATKLESFSTPSDQQDLSDNPQLQDRLNQLWNWNMQSYTAASRTGNPWTNTSDDNRNLYYDPIGQTIPDNAIAINWVAFPNRLSVYFGGADNSPYQLSPTDLYELADLGFLPGKPEFEKGFPKIPSKICPTLDWQQDKSQWQDYGPGGPRGWLDEYSEFAVQRDSAGEIRRIHFTCENPEYWFSLWRVDPQRVADLYNQVLGVNVSVVDLALRDSGGKVIVDSVTGQPVYNPLNPWNNGTHIEGGKGGAMHLTSPPNTIGAEIYLGAAATLQRQITAENYNAQNLICCSQYGQPFRNSDPHIGFNVNQLVKNANLEVTLANPVGLYIQTPDFSQVKIAGGTDPASLWRVVRGRTRAQTGGSYDEILHAVFEIPESIIPSRDITVGGLPLKWASQIQQTFHVALAAWGIANTGAKPTAEACVGKQTSPNPWPQLFIDSQALKNSAVNAPLVNVPPVLKRGQTVEGLALLVVDGHKESSIRCDDPDVTITVVDGYVPPGGGAAGQTGNFSTYAYVVKISVGANATPGLKGVIAVNPGNDPGPACPGLLVIA